MFAQRWRSLTLEAVAVGEPIQLVVQRYQMQDLEQLARLEAHLPKLAGPLLLLLKFLSAVVAVEQLKDFGVGIVGELGGIG